MVLGTRLPGPGASTVSFAEAPDMILVLSWGEPRRQRPAWCWGELAASVGLAAGGDGGTPITNKYSCTIPRDC